MRRFFPKASHNTDSTQDVPQDVGDKFERFRILIVGRASAGKTTLLQRVCNTTGYPQVFDSNGTEIDVTVVKSSIDRGQQDIEDELVFQNNPDFVFHECGFEAGDEDEFRKMMKFVSERTSNTTRLEERIRAIWYCIPMDEYNRAIMSAERKFFSECDTRNTPVIAVFTKFDALYDDAYGQLRESGLTRNESSKRAPELAKEIFANAGIWARLCDTRYPPKDFVCLAEMNTEYDVGCGPLLEVMCNGRLFESDLDSLWQTANKNWCDALLHQHRVIEAIRSCHYMMDMIDEAAKTSCLEWSTAFKQDCIACCVAKGEEAAAAGVYEEAIKLYSAAIGLDSSGDSSLFARRSRVKLDQTLYAEALADAEKVIELNPSSYIGYELKYTALHGAQCDDEATEAFKFMLSKLDDAPDAQMQKVREHYVSPSHECAIRTAARAQLENTPHRLLDTSTGRLCDKDAQIHTFITSTEYKGLLASIFRHADLSTELIQDVVRTYFRYVMLSHRWEGKEPSLRDIRGKIVYDANQVGGIAKLQSFCNTSRNAGFRWAWIDTCCIDQSNNVEVQESVNSMFIWYRHSALTIIYLSDVPPLSKSGALAESAWNTRGWTVQEFLAPKIVLFYQQDWTLYLDDQTHNHKDSATIMQELGDATGIDAQALVTFRPGMRDAREKLRWASTRVTTLQEDIAYSLFGIFGVHLPVIYGERKQNALGRLLQEIVARSGDITALDWVGRPSEFNSCLPADITSYKVPPRPQALLSLSEDEIHTSVSSLRNAGVAELSSALYVSLDESSAPRFANSRLQLPCIVFPISEVKRKRGLDRQTCFTYGVKADGLQDLLITTEDRLVLFSPAKPAWQTFLLVRPRNRYDLGLPDFADETKSIEDWAEPAFPSEGSQSAEDSPEPSSPSEDSQSTEDWPEPESPSDHSIGEPSGANGQIDSDMRALKLVVRLGQPFGALLLAQQRGGEYKRIASDRDIIARVKDPASVSAMMDIRTLEIL